MTEQTYDNRNSGAFFKNDKKETDRHPDYKGNLNVDGVDYWISGWMKKSKAGKPYMSLAVKPKDVFADDQKRPTPANVDADMNDEMPF